MGASENSYREHSHMPDTHDDKPLIYRKARAYRLLGVGRTMGDALCSSGDLETIPLGPRAIGITRQSVERVATLGAQKRAAAKPAKRRHRAALAAPGSAA